ncbi:MAG: hypothetical protein U1D67_04240 [Dehalococcoidia bacterium]|nr:hypothetical protein [Dehalococcoidia bacterium]
MGKMKIKVMTFRGDGTQKTVEITVRLPFTVFGCHFAVYKRLQKPVRWQAVELSTGQTVGYGHETMRGCAAEAKERVTLLGAVKVTAAVKKAMRRKRKEAKNA